jgi:hypothetical protein
MKKKKPSSTKNLNTASYDLNELFSSGMLMSADFENQFKGMTSPKQ